MERVMSDEAMAPLPKGHPMLEAWEAFRTTPEYENARHWAQYMDHIEGSLWAAFTEGWNRRGEQSEDAERLRDALAFIEREGYRRCDMPACNCNGWHGGRAYERLREIGDAVYTNGRTILASVEALKLDAERIDAMEAFIEAEGGIVLHNGKPNVAARLPFPGLGLRSTGRTLRKAIDDMRATRTPASIEGEHG
jgi:hypothetical protein